MAEYIRHEGLVLSAQGEQVQVQVVQTSACAACHAKSMCMAAESQEKILTATALDPNLQAGDRVEVYVMERLGWKAVLLAYILPFVVLMSVVGILGRFLSNEILTGTIALIAVAVYYLILSLFKQRLHKQFTFYAKRL